MLFRVWDKKNNRYSKEDLLLDKDGDLQEPVGDGMGGVSCCPVLDYKNYDVEFNTGITLADGTETFYGDIVRWKDSMFDSKGGDGYRYWRLEIERMRRLPWVWTDIIEENCFRKDIELVGNIHETELTDAMKLWINGQIMNNEYLSAEEKDSLLKSLAAHNFGIKYDPDNGTYQLDVFDTKIDDTTAKLLNVYMNQLLMQITRKRGK